jgi:hypothetical protein
MTGKALSEALEAAVCVDVVDDNRATGAQNSPRPIHLKANVVFTVQAIMNEKIDLSELREQAG